MEKIPYKLTRSRPKTLDLELWPEGLNVWVSLRATNRQVEYIFVEQHRQWIWQHQGELERQAADFPL